MFERVLLRDNRDLTPAEFVRLEELRARIVAHVEARELYISTYGLDQAFALPDANWKNDPDRDFFQAYRHLSTGNYEVLNRLRFWAQAFSGYQIMTLSMAGGLHSVNPIPDDFDNWIQTHRPEPDGYVQQYRMLSMILPSNLLYSPPRLMGELGWEVNGKVASFDTYHYQARISLLHEAGAIDFLRSLPNPRVLEIGGGYGALALALRQIVPNIHYTLCDLPESLLFAGMYLSAATGSQPHVGDVRLAKVITPALHLLPNYMFTELLDKDTSFDLVINTWSLAEMSQHQVQVYAAGISQLIGTSGQFFEQNHDTKAPGGQLSTHSIIAPYFRSNRILHPIITPLSDSTYCPNIWSNSTT